MKRPNKTATKELIWEYVEGIEAELKAKQAGTFDPAAEKEATRKKDVAAKAEKIMEREIVNDEIKEEYNCLMEKIEDLKSEVKTLIGITPTVGTLATLIEANNLEIAEVKRIKDELITEKTAELEALKLEIAALTKQRVEDEKTYAADLKKKRDLEEEEYQYDIKRKHSKEDDTWDDLKAEREKTLADKEATVSAREITCKEIEETNATLQAQVDAIPSTIAEVKSAVQSAAEADMKRILAIKEAAMKKEVEFDLKMKEAELTNTKEALAKEEAKTASLEAKLEAAYKQMNDLATKSVSSGQANYVNRDAK